MSLTIVQKGLLLVTTPFLVQVGLITALAWGQQRQLESHTAALEWAVSYPDSVASAIPIATTARHSAQQIAFNEVGRQAIVADPDWNEGNYYDHKPPARGLAVARMVGHITYMSDEDFKEQLETLNEELEALNAQARDLEQTIAGNVAEILEA